MHAFWKTLLAITCIASLVSCYLLLRSNTTPHKVDIAKPQYRVSYDYARKCIETYKNVNGNNGKVVTSFLIERQDFLQALGMDSVKAGSVISPYTYIRGYIGLDPENGVHHMFFTPVDSVQLNGSQIVYAGRDVVLRGKRINQNFGSAKAGVSDPDGEDPFLLDLNAPCPTTCNFTSMFDSTAHR